MTKKCKRISTCYLIASFQKETVLDIFICAPKNMPPKAIRIDLHSALFSWFQQQHRPFIGLFRGGGPLLSSPFCDKIVIKRKWEHKKRKSFIVRFCRNRL